MTIRKAEDAFTEIGLGVRARVGGSLVEVAGYGASAAISGPLRECWDELIDRGATPLVVYRDCVPVGVLGVSDRVRPDAAETIKRLKRLGLDSLAILSGDHEKSARLVAEAVGLSEVHSSLKPGDKLEIIRKHQERGQRVMFVGDGINDAPALAAADVGVAMAAAGTDVALETADAALIHDDVSKLPFLIRLSRRMLFIIKVNIAFGLAFNMAAVAASGAGLLTPMAAALVHNIGSVLVVMASASLAVFSEREG